MNELTQRGLNGSRVFVVDSVKGDGVDVDRVIVHSLYASRSAADAFCDSGRYE